MPSPSRYFLKRVTLILAICNHDQTGLDWELLVGHGFTRKRAILAELGPESGENAPETTSIKCAYNACQIRLLP
jgi:hypothetical protein